MGILQIPVGQRQYNLVQQSKLRLQLLFLDKSAVRVSTNSKLSFELTHPSERLNVRRRNPNFFRLTPSKI